MLGRREEPALSAGPPPVTVLAGLYALGVAAGLAGAGPLPAALLLLTGLALPIPTWWRPAVPRGPSARPKRPAARLAAAAILAAGLVHATAHLRSTERDCRLTLADGTSLAVGGVVRSEPRWGRVVVAVRDGMPQGCAVDVQVRLPREGDPPEPGVSVRIVGRWRADVRPGPDPSRAGALEARLVEAASDVPRARTVSWQVGALRRIRELFPRRAALVSALVLARKDGLDPAVRDAFARSGTAHLLAISGFHVGVVAGLLLAGLGSAGLGRRSAAAAAALGVWAYVAFIGAPDAAVRAAVLLTLAAVGRLLGRPLHAAGALSAAFLGLLLVDPGALLRPGFQLSFAGAGGLVVGARPLEAALERRLPGSRWSALRSALAAGVAATLATLPVVAWHFDRVSLVGIPATLAGTPLVAAAIPGIFAASALHVVHPPAGAFLAGGVELLLDGLVAVMDIAAGLPFAVVPVGRPFLVACAVGVGLAGLGGLPAGRLRARVRWIGWAAGVGAALLAMPVAAGLVGSGSVEVRILDVGQGDAIAVRSPAGRWILVDAGPGPPPGSGDARTLPVVRELRRMGVGRLEALVLSHPDLDHIGGVAGILGALDVEVVADPGRSRETSPYMESLRSAAAEPAPWLALLRGDRLDLDGVTLEVLHPAPSTPADADPNDASVVLLLRFGLFTALLTGDIPVGVEEDLADEVGPLDLLKVAHHGSRTSSSARFLEVVRPAVSVISVGRRNRYGHPHPEVNRRLLEYSDTLLRTDRDGAVRVVARRDGSVSITSSAGGAF